ncbi:hypothetical protein [Bacillus marasmi]|uniref:hypothetical protein n=1 Tax=Bacillus marasmi TaxID=1926279 RepID=UPI0011CC6564|nr:hypothetical protein [Bacillus marasmi]
MIKTFTNTKKKITTISTGIGAAGLTVGTSLTGSASSLCTGACGSCGLGCGSAAAIAAAGFVIMIGRKRLKNGTVDSTKK